MPLRPLKMSDDTQGTARPASVDDLKLLLRLLADNGVKYLLIGGDALYALGYQRARWTLTSCCNRRLTRANGFDAPS